MFKKISISLIALAFIVSAGSLLGILTKTPLTAKAGEDYNLIFDFATTTQLWAASTPTKIASYNSHRAFLEISNISGATTTAQDVYCSTASTTVSYLTKYTGIYIKASSTVSFYPARVLPLAPVYCVSANTAGATNSSALLTVLER